MKTTGSHDSLGSGLLSLCYSSVALGPAALVSSRALSEMQTQTYSIKICILTKSKRKWAHNTYTEVTEMGSSFATDIFPTLLETEHDLS